VNVKHTETKLERNKVTIIRLNISNHQPRLPIRTGNMQVSPYFFQSP